MTEAGVTSIGLSASRNRNSVLLSGSFGVFFPGRLTAYLFDIRGVRIGAVPLQSVSPLDIVKVQKEIPASPATARISIHLMDEQGIDRGLLGEASINVDRAP